MSVESRFLFGPPSVGSHALPFIDEGGSRGYRWVKRGNYQGYRRSFEGLGTSFSSKPASDTASWCQRLARSPGACVPMMLHLYLICKWSRPVPPPRAACRAEMFPHGPVGSGWCGDRSFVTVEDGSPSLDCIGCPMLMSGSSPGAEGDAYNTVGRKVCAHNTIQLLPYLEGSKAPVPSCFDSTFLQRRRAWSSMTRFDPNALSYPVLIIMRERGAVVR